MEETSIRFAGDFTLSAYGAALNTAFRQALAIEHKLPPWILNMQGMSGRKYRSLVNTLVAQIREARYLEVGTWAGSTACSAMFGNRARVICIDNWSQFGGPKHEFLRHVQDAKSSQIDFQFLEADFRQVAWSQLPKNNIYLFDGPHTEQDQFDGIVLAQPALDSIYVLIVDDYNWPAVREGTARALAHLHSTLECAIEIRTTQNDTHPVEKHRNQSDWHNGYFLAVVRKRNFSELERTQSDLVTDA